jgi:large subunit ribosomal protein L18
MDKKPSRARRSRQTRVRIAQQRSIRLAVHRTNMHIYAQVIDATGGRVMASASTVESEIRGQMPNGGNIKAAELVGKRIAEKARALGVSRVAFDRSGCRYHGRIKALADSARKNGLEF